MSVHDNSSESNSSTETFGRVFRKAPWRRQTQLLSGIAVVAALAVAIGSMALAETSRAAAAGRDVQQLRYAIQLSGFENMLLRSKIASASSVVELEARARRLGLVPFPADRIFHLQVAGFETSDQSSENQVDDASPDLPVYEQTLRDWLIERTQSFSEKDH